MKVNPVNNYLALDNKKSKLSFGAYRPSVNEHGEREHNFYVAHDPNKYNAVLEIFETKKQDGTWKVDFNKRIHEISMPTQGISVKMSDLQDLPYEHLAYRYRLDEKDGQGGTTGKMLFQVDNGTKTTATNGSTGSANVLYSDRIIMSRPQNAILIMPDMFNYVSTPDYSGNVKRGIPKDSLRNHFNMLGGNLKGITDKLADLKDAGYTRIVGTPFTKDSVSSHKYWTQNAYQIAPSLGTMRDFEELQQGLVKNGISWIADGAFVNEGLQGVHFKSILKWGEQSPFKNWFYLTDEPSKPVTVGIFPESNTEDVKFRLVNSKHILSQDPKTKDIIVKKNPDWNSTQPTYLQFYDKRLIRPGEENIDGLIKQYSNISAEASNHIITHDDSINPYSFEINPDELISNIVRRNAVDKKSDLQNPDWDLQSIDTMKDIFSFSTFNFDRKKMGGYVCWDGNVDIPKMNLHVSASDLELYKDDEATKIEKARKFANGDTSVYMSDPINDRYIGVMQVKDYMVNAGRYWTATARDMQVKHVAQLIGESDNYLQTINDLVEDNELPASIKGIMSKDVVSNVINGTYEETKAPLGRKKALIREAIQSVPLDALNFSDELMASFSSPYISKRPFSASDVDMSRDDIEDNDYQNIPKEYRDVYKKFDKTIKTQLVEYISTIFDIANKDTGNELFNPNESNPIVTQKGAEVIKLMVPEITKSIMELAIQSTLFKDTQNSHYNRDVILAKAVNTTPQTLGINASSPKEEANMVVDTFIKGMKRLNSDDNAFVHLRDTFVVDVGNFAQNTSLNSIKLAKVIVDRGETGLGWRIDAAKDVSNMDDLREGVSRFDDAWDNVIDVWASFAHAVREENPNAYLTAEVTDLDDFLKAGVGPQANTLHLQKYKDEHQAELAFLEKTGITSFANYKYFYSGVKDLIHASSETGTEKDIQVISRPVREDYGFRESKFIYAWPGNKPFLDHGPYDAVQGAYNFYENHDKPRILHTNALNMQLFHGSLVGKDEENSKDKIFERNRRVAQDVLKPAGKDYLYTYDYATLNPKALAMAQKLDNEIVKIENVDSDFVDSFKKAVGQIVLGNYKGEEINTVLFGVRPFEKTIDMVFEQMRYNGMEMPEDTTNGVKTALLNNILAPACSDAYVVYKIMSMLPGMITDFAGHKQGATGYESLKNNLYQQNRNRINWEWTDEKSGKVIPAVKDFERKMTDVLLMRKDPSLSALATGETVLLPLDDANSSVNVMSLFRYNDLGSKVVTVMKASHGNQSISRILLNNENEGLTAGLSEELTFVNAGNLEDKCIYKVVNDEKGRSMIAKFWSPEHYEANKNNPSQYLGIDISEDEGNVLILKCADDVNNHTEPQTISFKGLQAFSTYKNSLENAKVDSTKLNINRVL